MLCRRFGCAAPVSVESVLSKTHEVIELAAILVADMDVAVPDHGSDRHRRAYVRALFAYVEGTLAGLKAILTEYADLFGVRFTAGEAAMLVEVGYSLKEDGSVRVSPSFLRIADNVRFALSLSSKVTGVAAAARYDDRGWASFKKSIVIRNRLMHPKHVSDLTVTDQEIADVGDARTWYKDAIVAMLLNMIPAIRKRSPTP